MGLGGYRVTRSTYGRGPEATTFGQLLSQCPWEGTAGGWQLLAEHFPWNKPLIARTGGAGCGQGETCRRHAWRKQQVKLTYGLSLADLVGSSQSGPRRRVAADTFEKGGQRRCEHRRLGVHRCGKVRTELGPSLGQVDIGLGEWAQAVAQGLRSGKLATQNLESRCGIQSGQTQEVSWSVNHQGRRTQGAAVGRGGGQASYSAAAGVGSEQTQRRIEVQRLALHGCTVNQTQRKRLEANQKQQLFCDCWSFLQLPFKFTAAGGPVEPDGRSVSTGQQ
jgi:hypothetical protein